MGRSMSVVGWYCTTASINSIVVVYFEWLIIPLASNGRALRYRSMTRFSIISVELLLSGSSPFMEPLSNANLRKAMAAQYLPL